MSKHPKSWFAWLLRFAALSCVAVSVLGIVLSMLVLPDDSIIAHLLAFGPSWIFGIGLSPLFFLLRSALARGLTLALVVSCVFVLLDFRFGGKSTKASPINGLRLATFNVGGGEVSPEEVVLWFESERLDLLALQEVYKPERWRRSAQQHGLFFSCQGRLCIASTRQVSPVRDFDRRALGGWGNFAAEFEWCVNETCIPIVNIHLDTPRHATLSLLKRQGFARVRSQLGARAMESRVARQISDDARAVFIGDFNMKQSSSTYRRHWSHLTNAFGERGFGLGHTRFSRRFSARIDHVLVGADIVVEAAVVGDDYGSDHHPLLVSIKLNDV